MNLIGKKFKIGRTTYTIEFINGTHVRLSFVEQTVFNNDNVGSFNANLEDILMFLNKYGLKTKWEVSYDTNRKEV